MKKTVIVSVPMKYAIDKQIYKSSDASLLSSGREVEFPVVSFLETKLSAEDEVKVILIAKRGEYSFADRHIEELKKEMEEAGISASFDTVDSEFEESRDVHEKLMRDIVSKIDCGTALTADVTYGSKDVPVVVFAAMNFAEKHLGCEVENIIYGQAFFSDNGKVAGAKLCDLAPLYTLNNLSNVIKCDSGEKAKKVLDNIISL